MSLNELIEKLQIAKAKAGDADVDVEFWCGDNCMEVDSIGQFNIIPDVVIHLSFENKDEAFEKMIAEKENPKTPL